MKTLSKLPVEGGALDVLEDEAIYIFRETAGQFERPVILFSGGKNSTVLVRLAVKAFRPAPVPMPLLHVDTGHNFAEVIRFRDRTAAELGLRLIVASVHRTGRLALHRTREHRGAVAVLRPSP